MKKVALYNDKVFLNARSFHDFVVVSVFDGNVPHDWLSYVSVCFSRRLKTISGVEIDWVTLNQYDYDCLQRSSEGWMRWTKGKDKTFVEFVASKNESFNKERLWTWVIDYVLTYDLPRSRMKSLVDEVIKQSENLGKKSGVNIYILNSNKLKSKDE